MALALVAPTNLHLEQASEYSNFISQIRVILRNTTLYKRFLASRGSDAQALLDTLQQILDDDAFSNDPELRRNLVVATHRLSSRTNLYPTGFELQDVSSLSDWPVGGGGYADIFTGNFAGRTVCLKVIRMYKPFQVAYLWKEYSREAILWRQLRHPNILPFLGISRLQNRVCFVSPWAINGRVGEYLLKCPSADRLMLCLDVAMGVSYLHDHNVIHSDLKGANVLVDVTGRALVADFGLSSVSDPKILHWTSQSTIAPKGGTARWQAPELHDVQSEEIVHNTTASDMYAWACVCYEIFTENVPFFECHRDATVVVTVNAGKHPTRPRESRPWKEWNLTDDIWNLMEECWVSEPAKRPSASDIVTRLREMAPVDARPTPTDSAFESSIIQTRGTGHIALAMNTIGRIFSDHHNSCRATFYTPHANRGDELDNRESRSEAEDENMPLLSTHNHQLPLYVQVNVQHSRSRDTDNDDSSVPLLIFGYVQYALLMILYLLLYFNYRGRFNILVDY